MSFSEMLVVVFVAILLFGKDMSAVYIKKISKFIKGINNIKNFVALEIHDLVEIEKNDK